MLNKVILIGRLTRDPDLRYPSSNVPVANFTIAVSRSFTNQNGEREADFVNIIAWRKLAEVVKNYTTKGSLVAVDGRIQTRSYTASDNTKRYVTEVVAEEVKFLSPRSQGTNNSSEYNGDSYETNSAPTVNIEEDPYEQFGNDIEITDDLPF